MDAKTQRWSPGTGFPVLRDFPDILGPMIVKELRQGTRAKIFVVPFLGVHLLMLIALGFDLSAEGQGGAFFFGWDPLAGQGMFWLFSYGLLLLVTPFGGLGALQREASGANVELLLMTKLSRWRIVFGIWLVLCALGGLIALTLLPYLLVRYFLIGGMNVVATATVFAILVVLNAVANALAIGLSGYSSLALRFVIGLFAIPAIYIAAGIGMASGIHAAQAMGIYTEFNGWAALFTLGCVVVIALYFIMCGLQLGRARIRLFEHPFEPPPSRAVVTLIVISPLIFGMVGLFTVGYGVIPGFLFFTWVVYMIDRPPPKRGRPLVNAVDGGADPY